MIYSKKTYCSMALILFPITFYGSSKEKHLENVYNKPQSFYETSMSYFNRNTNYQKIYSAITNKPVHQIPSTTPTQNTNSTQKSSYQYSNTQYTTSSHSSYELSSQTSSVTMNTSNKIPNELSNISNNTQQLVTPYTPTTAELTAFYAASDQSQTNSQPLFKVFKTDITTDSQLSSVQSSILDPRLTQARDSNSDEAQSNNDQGSDSWHSSRSNLDLDSL